MLKMLVSISTLGRSRRWSWSWSWCSFIYVIAIISSFRRIFFLSIRLFSFIVSNVGCWFNCYSRDCPTVLSVASLSLKWLNCSCVCVCLHLNTVFEFGKYEITTQIETFVWAFIFLLRLSCDNAVSWSQLHHNIMLVSLSFRNAHSEWIIFCFDFFFSLSNKTCNFAFVYTIRLSNHSIKKRMGARNWKQ